MKYQFTPISSNQKTGPIPTTMTEKDSCPDTCPLKLNGCYAENFPLSLHWQRVSESGISVDQLAQKLGKLPRGQLWRHNVAGDLPHKNGTIDTQEIKPILSAVKSRGLKTILYTHHKIAQNYQALSEIRDSGINVNVSTESPEMAISALNAGFNSVCIMPDGSEKLTKYLDGYTGQTIAKIVICPAQTSDRVTCAACGLCAKDRTKDRVIIGFLPHGARAKSVRTMLQEAQA